MAARKSCTHLTWAEAKGKTGNNLSGNSGGGSGGGNNKNVKRENHGKLLAAKIVAKSGPSETEAIKNRQAARRSRRDQQRQEQLEAERQAEKERQRQEAVTKPHEQALDKLKSLAIEYKTKSSKPSNSTTINCKSDDEPSMICESKQLQVNELLALEAIYADTSDVLIVADECHFKQLQEKVDAWDGISHMDSIICHPSLRFVLQKSVHDPNDDDWTAHCLLEIVFPNTYPLLTTPPYISIEWFLLTQKSLVVAQNKPLETMGILDEKALLQALSEEAQTLLGMPSIYELLETWWNEHVFEYITLNPILP